LVSITLPDPLRRERMGWWDRKSLVQPLSYSLGVMGQEHIVDYTTPQGCGISPD